MLDRIRDSANALFEEDTAEMRARYPEMKIADERDVAYFWYR